MDCMIFESILAFQTTAAQAVRKVTSTALEVLATAEDVAQAERTMLNLQQKEESAGVKRKGEEIVINPRSESNQPENEDGVELNLSFGECEALLNLGKLTNEQIRTGRVTRRDWVKIQQTLKSEGICKTLDIPERAHILMLDDDLPMTLDCGLKRVDSKRYKRDYVINRSPRMHRKTWDVTSQSPLAAEIIKATPAGEREVVVLDDTEENVSRNLIGPIINRAKLFDWSFFICKWFELQFSFCCVYEWIVKVSIFFHISELISTFSHHLITLFTIGTDY